jgi:hypothetical protein
MSTYKDLTIMDSLAGSLVLLAVGWLGPDVTFDRGAVPKPALGRLLALATEPQNLTRGLHYCWMCDAESPIEERTPDGSRVWLGNGEIHVPKAAGVTYAMPTLGIDYITAHRYLPPQDFIGAVMDLDM